MAKIIQVIERAMEKNKEYIDKFMKEMDIRMIRIERKIGIQDGKHIGQEENKTKMEGRYGKQDYQRDRTTRDFYKQDKGQYRTEDE